MTSYTVIYRTGGPMGCDWIKCRPVTFMSEAVSQKESIERGGRKAIIHTTSGLTAAGLPVGWCAQCDASTGKCTERRGCEAKGVSI